MEILTILETLEELVEKSPSVPFSGKCLLDREEILEIIKEMRLKLPDDIKQAKWVKEERQRILLEAQREANNIMKDAENKIASLVDEHEITKKAYEQSNEIIAAAQKNAREVRLGAREYADGVLNKVEDILTEAAEVIRTNREELK
ncbi:ATPase [Ruminiclostridium cellulolyticum]|uniref:H+-ATPase subunit H n=1 Tax=Ruminiclostridium cellulolyticum (strain ATCC 35319 / DSM 5812 / JCM 6584 / H10) TaxID=394503 RepID=B8I384_RUMCH|nr:ATPase [Ruminiclostridium cellulolyticum]ACL76227.1 H+-ATPase subunit H [Ruminiclostridium cellulolyticum H10]